MSAGHKHNHSEKLPLDRREESQRLKWALLVTGGILVAELVGGILSGSLALISDAGHMFVDAVALMLSYVAIQLAARKRNDKFTFGFHRVEILAALINGITLLIICAYIVYEAIQRFLVPVEIDVPLMLAVAVIGTISNVISAVLLRHAHTLNVRSAFLHVLGDLFSSVGILIGGVVMLLWDVPWLDPALSIVIAGVILISAYRLTTEAIAVLMEAAPPHIPADKIRVALLGRPPVEDVHSLHVWTITSGKEALNCHIVLKNGWEDRSDEVLSELSAFIRQEFGIAHITLQIETAEFGNNSAGCAPDSDQE